MAKVTISAPWIRFYREITALFENDPDINIVYDEENNRIKLYVADVKKAEAMAAILPDRKTFGNITICVDVIPPNTESKKSFLSLFKEAFAGNPIVDDYVSFDTPITGKMDYVVFAKKVVQFFNDNLQDPNGNESTLYQDIAKDVFEDRDSVFFCTASNELTDAEIEIG